MLTEYIEAAMRKAKYKILNPARRLFRGDSGIQRSVGKFKNTGRLPGSASIGAGKLADYQVEA